MDLKQFSSSYRATVPHSSRSHRDEWVYGHYTSRRSALDPQEAAVGPHDPRLRKSSQAIEPCSSSQGKDTKNQSTNKAAEVRSVMRPQVSCEPIFQLWCYPNRHEVWK